MKRDKMSRSNRHSIFICFVIILFSYSLFHVNGAAGAVIIGFGDSITKGTPYVSGLYGNGRRVGGYEPKLEKLLKADNNPSYVYNWGIGGEDTSQGVRRIDDVIDKYSLVDYVLLMEGTNDIGLFSSSTTIHNLSVMLNKIKAENVRPIIATLTPDTENGPKTVIPTVLNPAIKKLAAQKKVILADQYAATIKKWSTLTGDGLHPNDAGYQILADTWFKVIPNISTKVPSVTTLSASAIGDTTATLNGTVNPNGSNTSYYFEYDTVTAHNSITNKYNAGSNNTEISVSIDLNSLTVDTIYSFRIVASNRNGSSFGKKREFKTTRKSSNSPAPTPTPSSMTNGNSNSGCFISTSRF